RPQGPDDPPAPPAGAGGGRAELPAPRDRRNALGGGERPRRGGGGPRGGGGFKPPVAPAECVERVGLDAVADELVDRLPTGTQRLVEVARALAAKPRVLLLDEPSAGLNEHETEALATLL